MTLEYGRPADFEQRLAKEQRVYEFMDGIGIEYGRVDHQEANTMEICAEIDKVLGCKICKNLFLCNRQQTQFYLLMIDHSKIFKTKDITGQLGCSRLSFASAEHMEKFLDITPGSVSVLGLMNDKDKTVRLAIDHSVLDEEFVGCHPCINTSSLKIKVCDLMEKILPVLGYEPAIVDLPTYTE